MLNKKLYLPIAIILSSIVLGGSLLLMQDTFKTKDTFNTKDTFKTNYMEGCDEGGRQTAYCECTYDKIVSEYNDEQIAEMFITVLNGEVPDEFMGIALECIDKYNYTYN